MNNQNDIIQRLRDNADLDEAEHGNARVVQLEREAADEIERLRGELSRFDDSVTVKQARDAVRAAEAALLAALKQSYPQGACVHVVHHRGSFPGEVTGWDVYGVREVVRNLSSGKTAKWWAAHVEIAA